MLMDTYIEGSLKEQMREKMSGPDPIRYHIADATSLKGISLKDFLSHHATKQDLTEYLCNALVETVSSTEKLIVVAYNNLKPALWTSTRPITRKLTP